MKKYVVIFSKCSTLCKSGFLHGSDVDVQYGKPLESSGFQES